MRHLADLLSSLYEGNPDAIAVYDRDGLLVACNDAALRLSGYGSAAEIPGRRFTDHIYKRDRERVESAFQSALQGRTDHFETTVRAAQGAFVPVDVYVFPARDSGGVQGVFVQAGNAVARQNAERAIALQGERIRELYLAAAARGGSVESQIDDTLALGCRLFGFDYGYVTRFGEATIAIVNATGEGAGVHAGDVYPRENALSRHLIGDCQTIFVPDLDVAPWNCDPARPTAPWRSYFATKLVVNNRDYGAMVFAARSAHGPIPDLDRDLLHLMALFVAAALERAQHAERIEQLAFYDALTGLPNRVLFSDRAKQALAASRRYGRSFAVMYLDLDNFKAINDRHGHPTGDLVLKAVADRLILALRESDTVARFGGDEFVILQPVVNGASDAQDLAAKIVASMQAPLQAGGVDHYVHTSIGIALFPSDAVTVEDLMECADRALYRAKRAGRNRWMFSASAAP